MGIQAAEISAILKDQIKNFLFVGIPRGIRYSQAVSHPSTNRALCCLTSVIGREPVYSAWYGRRLLLDES